MENPNVLTEEKNTNRVREYQMKFAVNEEEKEMIEQKFLTSGLPTKRVFF